MGLADSNLAVVAARKSKTRKKGEHMNLTIEVRKDVIDKFVRNNTIPEIAVLYGLGTFVVEGIIRDWVVRQAQKNALRT